MAAFRQSQFTLEKELRVVLRLATKVTRVREFKFTKRQECRTFTLILHLIHWLRDYTPMT